MALKKHRSSEALPRLVANPFAINESAPRFYSLGRTVAVPPLNTLARCYLVRMVRLSGMNRPGIFVIGCRSVGANAAGSVSRRSALGGICLLRSREQKQSDNEAEHTFASPILKIASADHPPDRGLCPIYLFVCLAAATYGGRHRSMDRPLTVTLPDYAVS